MGNSLRVVVDSYIGCAPFPCHLQLGESASIDLCRELGKKNEAGVVREIWTVSYKVDGKTCDIRLIGHGVDQHGKVAKVQFIIREDGFQRTPIRFWLVITETNFIKIDREWGLLLYLSGKEKRSFDARGGVMDTSVYLYGNANRGGLFVMESKKNSENEEVKVVTVAHYFVNSSETSYYRSIGTNIGLSVVANFRVSNGNFHITVDGPVQHPVSALLYLFDEVNSTGIWKPTMCPHCANIRKQRSTMIGQSDSEDSGGCQRDGRGIDNGGRFNGHCNGNYIENYNNYFGERWW